MNRKHLHIAVLAILLAVLPVNSAVTKYAADGAHSNIGFSIPILGGLSQVRGKFTDFTIEIVYDDKDVTKSTVNATIKATSIDTGIEGRDKHLRNADFFDVEKFPEITFKSSRIEKKGKDFIAHGTFTMHGVAKEIALPFTINGVRKDEKTGKTTLGATARATVNRKDYGVNFSRPDNPTFLGDMVEIELNVITRASSPEGTAAAAPATPAAN
ncbi:MAG TPA: YceI family protein [Pyrinomonadaceae bacterium]|jgi:polyisoprenoid-binding protein YceI|nr:YceI family protein [Pyrinomonadaceae bacterium]